ncbi:MAG: HpcH/HpaI aldolase family protein [Aeromicrobium sp.]
MRIKDWSAHVEPGLHLGQHGHACLARLVRTNAVKRRLAEGGRAIGTGLFEFATPGVIRIAAAAGADFLLIDTQHSGWTAETLKGLLATAGSEPISLLVRVPTLEQHLVGQALDLGADGVMAPNVTSADEARRLVRYARYPPAGDRGAAFGLARDAYRPVRDLRAGMDDADRETLLIALVESAAGIANLDEIASVDGIDVVWLGQFDLTLSMGIPGQFMDPLYRDAVAKVVSACEAHGKAAGFMATSAEDGMGLLETGFRCVSFANDVRIYRSALEKGVATLKGQIRP